ncbi:DUF2306 domain-containing protein [Xanthocytophaga agilis]|uniref:DUF2306 domain-containing protein n=1 Tax=Xanthocytophaga agilis TaxID=3048010 RepID=A0AAE3R5Z0_9BACT|nr:DUF2306 domain-containing protein [Xanthocytophaga agilis]MDJ1503855.1 DUF2306 domain-containing protein [Xanthocytophaga agilis]
MKILSLRSLLKGLMIFLSVGVAAYAFSYFTFKEQNLLASKAKELLASIFYRTSFYIHAGFGAIALFIGGWQFIKRFRRRYTALHRNAGKVYVIAVMLSSLAGLIIAFNANGGIVPVIGFISLAILWLITDIQAYQTIRGGDVKGHEQWMIRNYALTFAAVTLRLWIPVLQIFFKLTFLEAYQIVAWLCWIPNLLVAEAIIYSLRKPKLQLAEK